MIRRIATPLAFTLAAACALAAPPEKKPPPPHPAPPASAILQVEEAHEKPEIKYEAVPPPKGAQGGKARELSHSP